MKIRLNEEGSSKLEAPITFTGIREMYIERDRRERERERERASEIQRAKRRKERGKQIETEIKKEKWGETGSLRKKGRQTERERERRRMGLK